MDNQTAIRIELDIAAQKVINQIMINNEAVAKQLKSGFEKAFQNFDFEAYAQQAATRAIEKAIQESANYGEVRKLVEKRSNEIINEILDAKFKALWGDSDKKSGM
jgi:phosphomevalonate kinase